MLVEMRTILFGVSFTGWKENEDVVDQHNKSGYFSDIVDFDIPSKYICPRRKSRVSMYFND